MDIFRNTVFLIDDSPPILSSLSRLMGASGYLVRAYASAQAYLAEDSGDAPGCLLADVCLPGLTGADLRPALAARRGERPIIFLTDSATVPATVEAMRSGAVDFLTKPVDHTLLFRALDRACASDAENRMSREIRQMILRRYGSLTPRERQVMREVLRGRINRVIAMDMGTTEKTVKVHRARVMSKMEAASVVELVRLCALMGISMEPTICATRTSSRRGIDWKLTGSADC